ncbi:MAG: methyltransferase domain-containing protein [Lentisphaerae bacterium]|nr:MAG: methyltransferase domain-containing protein [Lentisphaerota bacterium]
MHLADFVRGIRPESSPPSGDAHDDFLHGMRDMAQKSLPHLLPAIDLSGRKKLLDLGGGPGTYAIHFCRQWQQLQAIVFDQPHSQAIAEQEIAAAGLTDRVSFMGGDLFTSILPEDCDAIWLSHILHMFSEGQVRELLRKVTETLAVPGLLIIHDFFLNDDACSPLFPTLFNINMYLNTAEGRSYQASQIRSILEDLGYVHIEHIPISNLNSSLITASLPERPS